MRKYSAFDIIGPAMIGPSSSHTAGAARLGKVAKLVAGGKINKVKFLLHGSFAKTYRGHGTDRALVAGILGMDPWDERLRDSLKIAEDQGLDIRFLEADLGDMHPNTVKFIITKEDETTVEVLGSSIGGGNISITEIDGEPLEFTGVYPTLIIKHVDVPGMVSKVTALMSCEGINIAFMKVYRSSKGETATMIFETDNVVSEKVVEEILSLEHIKNVRVISPISEQ
ncbi:L-serine ammonia-lyase, iron-sulfur-dependent subunit beta [Clostridium swellfunianum]|uniref:L-serine ammonia-lyase, iron-sulfur-dependent subunit beta n=1 Tax=Clostridium swellfunianum TaxID=1367462 RepID=UPI00202F7572|nr:L-serine ammonia-lyase, iron-sulfur-dependent subunit beta [Clostridium swellfunianum]MCM0646836.1 L-serine ammonia-lyase, iron-sulfur-dependent subunit beta [Clostridium swellfunianum]